MKRKQRATQSVRSGNKEGGKKRKEDGARAFERLWGVTSANREWHNEWVRTGGGGGVGQSGKTH